MPQIQVGTAQFGNSYGLTNDPNPLAKKECWRILDLALTHGVSKVDTAPDYGQSFSILSAYRGGELKVTSKIKVKGLEIDSIRRLIASQRQQLGSFHTLSEVLIHDFASLDNSDLEKLVHLQMDESSITFGVSLYEVWELDRTLNCISSGSTVQFPINILNQSFLKSIESSRFAKYRFTARSLMLQGALDWESDKNPFCKHLDIVRLGNLAKPLGLRPIELVTIFARNLVVDSIVIGFASETQIKDFFTSWNSNFNHNIDFSSLKSSDFALTDPRRW